jgi:hypothetical protein
VRGDSVRDFYAKTLAVVGLGLIAGAGAVVDYWPVSRPLPAVDDRLALFTAPALPQNLAQDIPLPAPVVTHAALTPPPAVIRPQHVTWPAFAQPSAVLAAAGLLKPKTRTVPAPVIPTDQLPLTTATIDLVAQVGEPIALAAYAIAPAPAEAADRRSAGPIAPDRPGQPGFLGGALKKTKDSIVRTGAATGASIADAFKGLFGAMKKVSPF